MQWGKKLFSMFTAVSGKVTLKPSLKAKVGVCGLTAVEKNLFDKRIV